MSLYDIQVCNKDWTICHKLIWIKQQFEQSIRNKCYTLKIADIVHTYWGSIV